MQFKQMFVTAVCVLWLLFLLKLKWPKSKNLNEKYNLKKVKFLKEKNKCFWLKVLNNFSCDTQCLYGYI